MKNRLIIDEAFKQLNDFKISDIILFDDISKIDIYSDIDLDGSYQELAESEMIQKYQLSHKQVQDILDKLKSCSRINQNDYYKTHKFLSQNSLTLDDCLEIIHKLTVEDYYANPENKAKYLAAHNTEQAKENHRKSVHAYHNSPEQIEKQKQTAEKYAKLKAEAHQRKLDKHQRALERKKAQQEAIKARKINKWENSKAKANQEK